jgi:hypothetical protein
MEKETWPVVCYKSSTSSPITECLLLLLFDASSHADNVDRDVIITNIYSVIKLIRMSDLIMVKKKKILKS